MSWTYRILTVDNETLPPEKVDDVVKQDSGWLTVMWSDGTFTDFPPHQIAEVTRIPEEDT